MDDAQKDALAKYVKVATKADLAYLQEAAEHQSLGPALLLLEQGMPPSKIMQSLVGIATGEIRSETFDSTGTLMASKSDAALRLKAIEKLLAIIGMGSESTSQAKTEINISFEDLLNAR